MLRYGIVVGSPISREALYATLDEIYSENYELYGGDIWMGVRPGGERLANLWALKKGHAVIPVLGTEIQHRNTQLMKFVTCLISVGPRDAWTADAEAKAFAKGCTIIRGAELDLQAPA